MRVRSALFDLYGDHVVRRGGWAPIGGLVRAMEALEFTGPATRTAVSRLVREGWLEAESTGHCGVRGYATTDRMTRQLDDARRRIYDGDDPPWTGRWDVVTLGLPPGRAARDRLAALLRYLRYAPLNRETWVAARRHPDLATRLAREGVTWRGFDSAYDGDDRTLAADLWDLPAIARGYRRFVQEPADGVTGVTSMHSVNGIGAMAVNGGIDGADPALAFAQRSRLVHRWRLFLFADPCLPRQVLPRDWPRPAAAARFREVADALAGPADVFVDDCLGRLTDEG